MFVSIAFHCQQAFPDTSGRHKKFFLIKLLLLKGKTRYSDVTIAAVSFRTASTDLEPVPN